MCQGWAASRVYIQFFSKPQKLRLCYACHSESDVIPSNFLKAVWLFCYKSGKNACVFPMGGTFTGHWFFFCIINSVDAGCSDTWKWDCNRAMAQLHQKEIQILTQGGGRWMEFQAIFTVHLLSRGCRAVTKNWWSPRSVKWPQALKILMKTHMHWRHQHVIEIRAGT